MRLSHPLRLGLATLAVSAALGAASALPAMADTGSSPSPSPSRRHLADLEPVAGRQGGRVLRDPGRHPRLHQAASATAISNRETRLQQLTADVNDSADITAGDKSTLLGQLSPTRPASTA